MPSAAEEPIKVPFGGNTCQAGIKSGPLPVQEILEEDEMAGAPMKQIFWRTYYAKTGVFLNPGIYIWTGKKHIRIIPFRKWRPDYDE